LPLESGLTVVAYTDGLEHAGERSGNQLDVCTTLEGLLEEQEPTAQEIADSLLANAIRLDESRPSDDISVVVLKTVPLRGDMVRRMAIRLPVGMD
jgi:serine phosphatase RsbU (regulator of sigma subunit)